MATSSNDRPVRQAIMQYRQVRDEFNAAQTNYVLLKARKNNAQHNLTQARQLARSIRHAVVETMQRP